VTVNQYDKFSLMYNNIMLPNATFKAHYPFMWGEDLTITRDYSA